MNATTDPEALIINDWRELWAWVYETHHLFCDDAEMTHVYEQLLYNNTTPFWGEDWSRYLDTRIDPYS